MWNARRFATASPPFQNLRSSSGDTWTPGVAAALGGATASALAQVRRASHQSTRTTPIGTSALAASRGPGSRSQLQSGTPSGPVPHVAVARPHCQPTMSMDTSIMARTIVMVSESASSRCRSSEVRRSAPGLSPSFAGVPGVAKKPTLSSRNGRRSR